LISEGRVFDPHRPQFFAFCSYSRETSLTELK
jgi:hypothetical protein